MDDNGTAPPVTDDLTVLSVEASDEFEADRETWIFEVFTTPPYSLEQHEIFKP